MTIRVIQIRAEGDPIIAHEELVYREKLQEVVEKVDVRNILDTLPTAQELIDGVSGIVIGGAAFSVTTNDIAAERAVLEEVCRLAYNERIPLLGICFGHQVVASAFGGEVIKDKERYQNDVVAIGKTTGADDDPLFSYLPGEFLARAHHEDHVVKLPKDAVHLLQNEASPIQGFRLQNRPMYGVQFHAELALDDLMHRYMRHPECYFPSVEERDMALARLRPPDAQVTRLLGEFARYAKDCVEQKNE